jgi:hypothetical protein
VGGQPFGEFRLGEDRGTEQAAEGAERFDVEVGALASPLGLDAVDVIGNGAQYTSRKVTY